ncbi:hypothetical protein [Leptospira santarosai]|uniref:hypothetical protein n=1 Tax=Leptospira santarosai TaxID=28183 RepID=UPI0026E3A4C3|nr:hypothetical protein [Leptospira santarosai]MDO6383369.1 hypothetical protein [Leptospira santarosai]
MREKKVVRIFRTNKAETYYKIIDTRYNFVKTMSLEAKGLLGICLARPDDWELHLGEVQKHSSNGETSHRTAWKDLERHGYFRRNKYRNELGQFVHEFDVYEDPSLNPHFTGTIPETKTRKQPDVKIKSGQDFETVHTPGSTRGNPHVIFHRWKPTPGNPPVENHALLNIEQPIMDELSTDQPKIEEPNTKEEKEEKKEESLSSKITFANLHKNISKFLESKKIRYNGTVYKETSAITWFMINGYEAEFVFETMTKLLLIKNTPPYKDDPKFWKPIPITISSLKSYVDQIHATAAALVETPMQRYAREAEEHQKKNPDPKDYEYFEDWVMAYNLSMETKLAILNFDSPEELMDPNTKKPKGTYAKVFFETFRIAKGGPCKFKRKPAA